MRTPSWLGIPVGSLAVALRVKTAPVPGERPVEAIQTVLERHLSRDRPAKQVILGTAELAADTVTGWHAHDGEESGYVLSGSLVLSVRGESDRILNPGDHFFNSRGLIHRLAAAPGTSGGSVVSTWVIDEGKPLEERVE